MDALASRFVPPRASAAIEEIIMLRRLACMVGIGIVLGVCAEPAQAVITRLTPLKEVLGAEQFIFLAKVEKLDPERPALVLTVESDLKEKVPCRRLPVNMTGDSEAKKDSHTQIIFKRLAVDLPVVVFASKRGKQYTGFVYSNGTWFQMIGRVEDDPAKVNWSLTHGEPYLRRTFKGTTDELKQIIIDGLANKKAPPDPNPKEEPGFGPEVKPKEEEQSDAAKETVAALPRRRVAASPPFAVIPTVFVMGPLALLAALFPAVFGGLALFMKRWMALLSVAFTNSTLFTLHLWLGGYARGAWWGSATALWVAMTVVTVLGALWSAYRYRTLFADSRDEAPRPGERLVLGIFSLIGVAVVVAGGLSWSPLEWRAGHLLASPWKEMLVYWVGAWAGALYILYLRWAPGATRREGDAAATRGGALPIELVVLWSMVFACTNLMGLELAGTSSGGSGSAFEGGAAVAGEQTARFDSVVWTAKPGPGSIVSSPLIEGDRVYVAAIQGAGLSTFGVLYCLERDSGKQIWKFDAEEELKQVFSTPCLAEGKIYIGEGLHENHGCRFFCVDAATGKEVWRFETQSHTESSPCVADGKVFFGAGDDGLYCLDAASGKKLWQFQPGLHVDASPTVVGKRLYCGSGVSRMLKDTEMFCLNIDDGTPVWRVPADLPVWGSPAAAGKHVYFGLGNGRFDKSGDAPAGAVLCLDAESGQRIWRCDVPDAVLVKPAVDEHSLYFGARDHAVYCVDRHDGRVVWKQDVGSPVVASPRLARCTCCRGTSNVYALGSAGQVCCLDPLTGRLHWKFDVSKDAGENAQLFSTPAVLVRREGEGDRRRIFFGAALTSSVGVSSARVYCIEDRVEGE